MVLGIGRQFKVVMSGPTLLECTFIWTFRGMTKIPRPVGAVRLETVGCLPRPLGAGLWLYGGGLGSRGHPDFRVNAQEPLRYKAIRVARVGKLILRGLE